MVLRSDKPQQSYTMQAFADDLAWLCERLGLAKPVVIGHSMGGIVAFDLAARYPALPSAVVMLDAAVVLPSATRAAIPQFLEKLRGSDYREVLRDYDAATAAGSLAVPGLYIAADELQPRSDMARFHEMFPQTLYGKTVGSGHFCQLEVPDQVNAMIERFLAISLPD